MRALVVDEPEGHTVLTTVEVAQPHPGLGEVLAEVATSGVNFLDAYQRTSAPPLQPPRAAGAEGALLVVAR